MKIEDSIRRFQCSASPLRYFSQAKGVKIRKNKDFNYQEQVNHPKGELTKKKNDDWATLLVP